MRGQPNACCIALVKVCSRPRRTAYTAARTGHAWCSITPYPFLGPCPSTQGEVVSLFASAGFVCDSLVVHERSVRNHKRDITMDRRWLQVGHA